MNFEKDLLLKIEEKETVIYEIEKALFTRRYNLSKKHFEIFSVQSIPMIYSILEGFVQQAFQLYIDKLNSLKIDFMDFNSSIRIFHMENSFKQLKEYPKDDRKKIEFYNKLKEFFINNNHLLYKQINTQSNISFEILNSILRSFGLEPFDEHWGKYKHPNPNLKDNMTALLKYRNGVAHGGDISSEEKVTQKVYERYKMLILDLMYEIRYKMIRGIENKTYLIEIS